MDSLLNLEEERPDSVDIYQSECDFSYNILFTWQKTKANQTLNYYYSNYDIYSIDTGFLIFQANDLTTTFEDGTLSTDSQILENTMNYYCDAWNIEDPFIEESTQPTLNNNLPGFLGITTMLGLIPIIGFKKYFLKNRK